MWLIRSNSNWNQFIFTFDEHSFCSLFSALYILLCYFIFIGLFPLIFPLVIYFEFLSKYDLIPWHVWSCVNNKNYDKQIKVCFVHSLTHRFNNKLNRVKKIRFPNSELRNSRSSIKQGCHVSWRKNMCRHLDRLSCSFAKLIIIFPCKKSLFTNFTMLNISNVIL